MNLTLFSWMLAGLVCVGLFLVLRQLLDIVADLSSGLAGTLRRRWLPGAARRLLAFQGTSPEPREKKGDVISLRVLLESLVMWRPTWITAGTLAALLLADRLLSPLAFTVIAVAGELFRSQRRAAQLRKLDADAAHLIVQFHSRYPLNRSLQRTLNDSISILPTGSIRRAAAECLARLNMNQKALDAVQPLREIRHPVVARFARLLADVQDTNQEVFLDTLRLLKEEVESRMELHQQSRQSLTLVRSTARVLQAVVVAAATAASLLPDWRLYFVASSRNWMLFLGMLGVAALGSFYIEAELRQLEAG